MQIIPLSQNPSSIFDIEIGGLTYTLLTKFNSRAGTWSVDLFESEVLLVSSLSLMLGVNIVEQYNFEIGVLFMADLSRTNLDAAADDLGSRVVLVQTTTEEFEASLATLGLTA